MASLATDVLRRVWPYPPLDPFVYSSTIPTQNPKRGPLWSHFMRFVFFQGNLSFSFKNCINRGFPGGAVVESLPARAGDTGSSPGLGGSHMLRSNWAREPQMLSLRVWSLCSTTGEAAIVRGPCTAMKSGPHLPQLERALAQKRRPNTAINK